MLQKTDFTLSDYYGVFKVIDMKLNHIINSGEIKHTTLATKLKICLDNRNKKLMDNPLLLVAIFLDPRYKFDLNGETDKIKLVELTIHKLWERKNKAKCHVSGTSNKVPNTSSLNTSDDMNSLFDELDKQYERNLFSQSDIGIAIDKYENMISNTRMKSGDSIMAFWEKNKFEFGVLYEIAITIFSIPPTQASVERSFSALKFLFDVHRCKISEELLECSLLIHLNSDFYYIIKEREIEQLLNFA